MFHRLAALLSLGLSFTLAGCGGGGGGSSFEPAGPIPGPDEQTRTSFGVNLDWATDSPAALNTRLGHGAAVFVRFFAFPLDTTDEADLTETLALVAAADGTAMITLEPLSGLATVTTDAAEDFAALLAAANVGEIPLIIRFGHEMNGSWYPWGQQPTEYIAAFRRLADAVHDGVPNAKMMWAPNYGGGYPFAGGAWETTSGEPDFAVLDTDDDGVLSMADDSYGPYYPGDDVVDWVGMSLYHWGSTWPWGENEVPEDGKFVAQLTGTYVGMNGDDSGVPDFYATYAVTRGKPLAITETAALFNTTAGGADELSIKQAWWRQVLDGDTLEAYPGIKLINWFEQQKPESEIGNAVVDWRVLGAPAIADPFLLELPVDVLRFADDPD